MDLTLATVAMSTPSLVLRYAAAFFFVVVAIAAAYALFKTGKTLQRVDTVLEDVDRQTVPLLQKAGTTLDEVNANLSNVDQITEDVAGITDKVDKMANAVEGAMSAPARKAAAFSAGVQSAVSSFMHRDNGPGTATGNGEAAAGWSYEPPAAADAAATMATEPDEQAAAEEPAAGGGSPGV